MTALWIFSMRFEALMLNLLWVVDEIFHSIINLFPIRVDSLSVTFRI